MKYHIGIDGGASKSDLIITDFDLNIIFEAKGDSTNPNVIGLDNSIQSISDLINSSLQKCDISPENILSVTVGSAGFSDSNTRTDIIKALSLLTQIEVDLIYAATDAEIALYGSFGKSAGAILIAGTGSIIFGKNELGDFFRVGGFGRLLGDEGSGYSIGKCALTFLAKVFDDSLIPDNFSYELSASLNVQDLQSLTKLTYSADFNIPEVAEFVIKLADRNIGKAISILDYESDKLIELIISMRKKMNLNLLPIALSGSLISNENSYSNMLREKIRIINGVEIYKPKYSPPFGAILLSMSKNNEK